MRLRGFAARDRWQRCAAVIAACSTMKKGAAEAKDIL